MTNGDTTPTQSNTLFLYIPVARLIVLSIVSGGIYEAYWIYKNWRYIKERKHMIIRPFWRGVFGVFFCHSLLKQIHSDKEATALLEPSFSAGGLATGWVILMIAANLIGRVPGIAAAIIAVWFKDLLAAVVSLAVMSLVLSLYFYLLEAPDVAIAEAGVGACITTALLVIAIKHTRRLEEEETTYEGDEGDIT